MAQPLLLSGKDAQVIDPLSERITELEEELDALRADLRAAELRTVQAESKAGRSVSRLRQQLSPLYTALQDLFGEIDHIAPGSNESTATPNGSSGVGSGNSAAWESVKQRLQPRHREVIDVLLLQGAMTRKQISSAIRMNYNNCTNNVVGPLLRQGWLVEVGGKIQLKSL